VQSILKNIEKIKKKSEVTPHELKPVENKKFIDALSKFSHHLSDLKKGSEESTPAKTKPVKIVGIKGTTRLDKDLHKHLNQAEKELAKLKTTFEKAQILKKPIVEKIATDIKKANAVLRKTEIVLVKGMALQKTLSNPAFHPKTESVIVKIQKEINFLQNRLSIQILTGTMQVQAHSFRSTLDEFRSRLRALKKLRRGQRVEAIEHEAKKQE